MRTIATIFAALTFAFLVASPANATDDPGPRDVGASIESGDGPRDVGAKIESGSGPRDVGAKIDPATKPRPNPDKLIPVDEDE